MKRLRIGTRRSPLAMNQASAVADYLREIYAELSVELIPYTTTGDQRMGPLTAGEEKGGGLKALFTKEIEEALLRNDIDLAVHSLKDMAAEIPAGLAIGAIPEREDARDAWIAKDKKPLSTLPAGAQIATGSVRRQAQLRLWRQDLVIEPLRGNVDTRLRRLKEESWDGIVLAMAGLKRLGRGAEVTEPISPDILLPAVGQGALAIECREDRADLGTLLASLEHGPSRIAITAERAFLKTLGGGCQTPLGAYAEVKGRELHLRGFVSSFTGHKALKRSLMGAARDAEKLGQQLAESLIKDGALKLWEDKA